jgi:hypothetical protein
VGDWRSRVKHGAPVVLSKGTLHCEHSPWSGPVVGDIGWHGRQRWGELQASGAGFVGLVRGEEKRSDQMGGECGTELRFQGAVGIPT